MLKFVVLTLLTFYTCLSFGQNKMDTSVVEKTLVFTESQNNEWINRLKKLTKSKQIEFIIDRLSLETKANNKLCCRPLIIIDQFYFGGMNFIKRTNANMGVLINLLNSIQIDLIKVLPEIEAKGLYESLGAGTVIYFKVSDEKSLNMTEKAFVRMNYYKDLIVIKD